MGGGYKGVQIISLEEYLNKNTDGIVVISTKYHYVEIEEQLLKHGIEQNRIINLGKKYAEMSHCQYFDLPDLYNKSQIEVFVDGGCYDADTSIDFIRWCQKMGTQGYVYAYELEKTNQANCIIRLEKNKIDYKMMPYGLWREKANLRYSSNGKGSSICEEGEEIVEVDCIDSLTDNIPTFIKMDIEGAEYDALLGAKNTIKKYKPKLAICVYHKNQDIWELPDLIIKMNSDYKFYLRHYSFACGETVLYAI